MRELWLSIGDHRFCNLSPAGEPRAALFTSGIGTVLAILEPVLETLLALAAAAGSESMRLCFQCRRPAVPVTQPLPFLTLRPHADDPWPPTMAAAAMLTGMNRGVAAGRSGAKSALGVGLALADRVQSRRGCS
jgi:hypothetical protein